jgi:hypothetical protein
MGRAWKESMTPHLDRPAELFSLLIISGKEYFPSSITDYCY